MTNLEVVLRRDDILEEQERVAPSEAVAPTGDPELGKIPAYGQKPPEASTADGTVITPRDVALFTRMALKSYNKSLHGEYIAKYMYIAGLLMGAVNGGGIGVVGPPGGGKSAITEFGWSIVNGLHVPIDVAAVPHRMDLTPAELIGKDSKMTRETTDNETGKTSKEIISAKVEPIIRPTTKVITFDEGNRTGPLAINAGLQLLQNGKMYVYENGERRQTSEIDLVATAINNHGTAYTNKFDPAFIGRHSMAAFMNERQYKLTEGANWRWDNPEKVFESKPFTPVIELPHLRLMRSLVPYVRLGRDETEYGKRKEENLLNYLQVEGMDFADTRPADQIIRTSQVFALMRGKDRVEQDDMGLALTFWTLGRLGMTGKIASNQEGFDIVRSDFSYSLDHLYSDREKKLNEVAQDISRRFEDSGRAALDEKRSFEDELKG